MTTKRDYKKEYREYHGKPEQIAARSQRNAARAKLGLSVGDYISGPISFWQV
jgi:hypothetical protein